MKKFVFAAIAAIVMVSVSNVFASNKMMSNVQVAPATPTDSSAVSTPVTPQAGAEDSTEQQNQEVATPAETVETAQASTDQHAAVVE